MMDVRRPLHLNALAEVRICFNEDVMAQSPSLTDLKNNKVKI